MSWFAQPPTPIPSSISTFTTTSYPSPLASSSSSSSSTAPRRRAPHPPYYIPRRTRPRHIRMREPAFSGLFTVSELDEMAAAGMELRTRSGSDAASGTGVSIGLGLGIGMQVDGGMRMSMDIDMDVDFDLALASSSSSTSTLSADSDSIATPSIHDDDTFFIDVPLDVDMESEDDINFFSTPSTTYPSTSPAAAPNAFISRLVKPRSGAARRPAPLDLSSALHHASSSSSRSTIVCGTTKSEEINRWSREVDSLTPKLAAFPIATQVLLPAFDTDPSGTCASPITPTPFSAASNSSARADGIGREGDPVSALESLFGECAEPDTSSLSPGKFSFTSAPSPRPFECSDASFESYDSCSSRSRSASPDANTIAAFPLPPMHTPVLSPAPDSASTSSSFASMPRTPVTPYSARRTVSNGQPRQAIPIACPGAPSPKARREREKARERQAYQGLEGMRGKEWAARHADLFALTYDGKREERGGAEAGRVVSMPERHRERGHGLGIKGVAYAGRASPSSPAVAGLPAHTPTSTCSTPSSSRSSSKSRKLPSRPSLPAHWMV